MFTFWENLHGMKLLAIATMLFNEKGLTATPLRRSTEAFLLFVSRIFDVDVRGE
jgi:hypothetical protein